MDAQLATRCPHCQTAFRVTMQQLELREGSVRCGACREIFNGIDTVFEYEPGEGFELTPPPAEQDLADRMTLIDFGSLRGTQAPSASNMQDELDALSRAIADLQAKPWSPPPASLQEELGSDAGDRDDDFHRHPGQQLAGLQGLPGSQFSQRGHDRQDGQDDEPAALRSRPAAAELPPLHAEDRRDDGGGDGGEPGFIQQARQRQRRARFWKVLLWIGIPLLLAALAAQLAFFFRNEIAARSPEAAPYLRAACRPLGCTIRLPMEIGKLSLVASQLDALGEGNGRYTLTALVRNQGDTVQAWPSLDLRLKDAEGKPALRKAFLPMQYMTKEEIVSGMPAHSEREIHILFDLAGDAPAGFELTLFYH